MCSVTGKCHCGDFPGFPQQHCSLLARWPTTTAPLKVFPYWISKEKVQTGLSLVQFFSSKTNTIDLTVEKQLYNGAPIQAVSCCHGNSSFWLSDRCREEKRQHLQETCSHFLTPYQVEEEGWARSHSKISTLSRSSCFSCSLYLSLPLIPPHPELHYLRIIVVIVVFFTLERKHSYSKSFSRCAVFVCVHLWKCVTVRHFLWSGIALFGHRKY